MLKPVLGSQLNLGSHIARGLVGYWLLNEGSGPTVFDLSGNGKVGTFGAGAASPIWVPGKFGSTLSFDGGDYFDTNFKDLNVTDNFSAGYWLKTTVGGTAQVIPFGMVHGEYIYFGRLNITTEGNLDFLIRDDASPSRHLIAIRDSSGTWRDGEWHHLFFVKSGNTQADLKIYLDGVDTEAGALYSNTLESKAVDISFFIGAYNELGNPASQYTGLLDVPMIYNRALSASEIALLYRAAFQI